jgi:hypothetical protein
VDTNDVEHTHLRRGLLQQRRRARNSRELSQLLQRREDLSGVSHVADFVVDSVRWTA